MDKRAIELSVNFLVTLILAIVIFGFGIKFIYGVITESETLRDLTLDELDDQIEALLCESDDKVCLGINRQTMERGDIHIFGIKVVNMDGSQHKFTVTINESGFVSNAGDYGPFPSGTEIDFKPKIRKETIGAHKDKDMGVGFHVKKAAPGKYIFTVKIEYDGNEYDSPKKIYVDVP